MIGYFLLGTIFVFKKNWFIASSCFISTGILFVYINAQVNPLNFNRANSPLRLWRRGAGGEVFGEGRGEVVIACFNVVMTNTNYDATIQSALSTQADFIVFEEIYENWAKELEEKLKDQYPYYKLVPQNNLYGIGVFSKYPLENIEIFNFGNVPSIRADIRIHHSLITTISSHLGSPGSYGGYAVRNKQLLDITNYLDTISSLKLAIGDYNATPWDECIINFKNQTQLMDSRKNLSPTFPTIFAPALIPLDYIFHSKEFECIEFKTIDNGDSDHKGIVGKYLLLNNN
jgi:endonuclease/exonuclease/phosphatase (EEP) superfamily protein YafD